MPAPADASAQVQMLLDEVMNSVGQMPTRAIATVERILNEVSRVCQKSDRIQASGQVDDWALSLARHRLQKCLAYYKRGSERGRVELHSTLSAMVYRYIAPAQAELSFQARYTLIEDFMQAFYIESLRAFRRENDLPETYQPRTRLELAEYLSFAEQYAKRRISLPGCRNQQLIVLRAKSFARRQPPEVAIDMELAVEGGKGEEAEQYARSSAVQQVREQMVSEAIDPAEAVLRDRILNELVDYLRNQGHHDCVDYLALKMQDLSAPEIDEVLGLSPRQRDYLQQRFKYHVERFSRMHNWELVHQWLGADVDDRLGMSGALWTLFWEELTPEQQQLVQLKQAQKDEKTIGKAIGCTPKQVQKRWFKLLTFAWQVRNGEVTLLQEA
ncbi:hypothetical protein AMR42_08375 [Limnothrix sp. PR1529]|nr:hypothetical protein AMR42_08375 [Limnothrix sp. PR1529]